MHFCTPSKHHCQNVSTSLPICLVLKLSPTNHFRGRRQGAAADAKQPQGAAAVLTARRRARSGGDDAEGGATGVVPRGCCCPLLPARYTPSMGTPSKKLSFAIHFNRSHALSGRGRVYALAAHGRRFLPPAARALQPPFLQGRRIKKDGAVFQVAMKPAGKYTLSSPRKCVGEHGDDRWRHARRRDEPKHFLPPPAAARP